MLSNQANLLSQNYSLMNFQVRTEYISHDNKVILNTVHCESKREWKFTSQKWNSPHWIIQRTCTFPDTVATEWFHASRQRTDGNASRTNAFSQPLHSLATLRLSIYRSFDKTLLPTANNKFEFALLASRVCRNLFVAFAGTFLPSRPHPLGLVKLELVTHDTQDHRFRIFLSSIWRPMGSLKEMHKLSSGSCREGKIFRKYSHSLNLKCDGMFSLRKNVICEVWNWNKFNSLVEEMVVYFDPREARKEYLARSLMEKPSRLLLGVCPKMVRQEQPRNNQIG